MTTPRPPKTLVGSARQTEPQGFSPYAQGGFGVIPRRGTRLDVCDQEGLRRWAVGSPIKLLKLLPDLHPDVGAALDNILRLAGSGIRIEAVRVDDGVADATEEAGQKALDALWGSLDREIGDFDGLVNQLLQEVVLTGLCCAEAVPGKRGQGVAEVWPVDSTTVSFRRKDGRLSPLQRQLIPKGGATYQGYADLSPDTFFWRALDTQVDDPYGRALFGTALPEVLCDLSLMRDLRDAMHANAWPRLKFAFDRSEVYRIATEIQGLRDQPGDFAATEWVEARFLEYQSLTAGMLSDDAIYYDKSGGVDNLTPGIGFQSINSTMEFLRARIVQSLKALPSIMGMALGNTETYSSVQWEIFALRLEGLRKVVVAIMLPVADLHLRLSGIPCKAKAVVQPIKTGEAKTDAEVAALVLKNESEYVRLGMKTPDQASIVCAGQPIQDASKIGNFEIQTVRLTEREQVGQAGKTKSTGSVSGSGD